MKVGRTILWFATQVFNFLNVEHSKFGAIHGAPTSAFELSL